MVDLNQDLEKMNSARKIGIKYAVDPKLRIEDNYEPIKVHTLEYIAKIIGHLISGGVLCISPLFSLTRQASNYCGGIPHIFW